MRIALLQENETEISWNINYEQEVFRGDLQTEDLPTENEGFKRKEIGHRKDLIKSRKEVQT